MTTDKNTACSATYGESQNQALVEAFPTPSALSEALVSMMTVADEKRMWRDFYAGHNSEKTMIKLTQVELGFYETAPSPCGKFKQFWIMRLRRLPGRNRLPRGFTSKQQFV